MIQKKSKNILTPLTREDRQNALENQAYTITSNLTRNESCQFIALCHILGRFGIYIVRLNRFGKRSSERNQLENQGWLLELYVGIPFSQYLHEMSLNETYGDELTLRTTADVFNIELSVMSSIAWHARQIIFPASSVPIWRGTLGHFAEGQGELCSFEPIRGTNISN